MAKSVKISRRHFLTSALAVSSGAAVANLHSFDSLRADFKEKKLESNGDTLTLNIDDYDELKETGGFKVIKEVSIGEITDSIIIVKKSNTEFLVYSSVCRHKRCNVKYKKDRDVFVCPCHGSTYDISGKVIKGPSKGDIPKYKVKLNNNKLEISI